RRPPAPRGRGRRDSPRYTKSEDDAGTETARSADTRMSRSRATPHRAAESATASHTLTKLDPLPDPAADPADALVERHLRLDTEQLGLAAQQRALDERHARRQLHRANEVAWRAELPPDAFREIFHGHDVRMADVDHGVLAAV